MEYKIGIVGWGWVGKAMNKLFPEAFVYDPFIGVENNEAPSLLGGERKQISECDITFVCVPTPTKDNKELDTSIVEEVVGWCTSPLIVLRSTVNPGTTDYLAKKYRKNIVMQPEYLGETTSHPMIDMKERPFLVIGGVPKARRRLIDLYTTVYNANIRIRQVSAYEAEVIKLSENRAIAFKVAQCQELYDVCELAEISYYSIREVVYGDDPRFNLWHTFIYPDKRGMNSKCIPKDVYAWASWAESLGYSAKITKALLEKNSQWVK